MTSAGTPASAGGRAAGAATGVRHVRKARARIAAVARRGYIVRAPPTQVVRCETARGRLPKSRTSAKRDPPGAERSPGGQKVSDLTAETVFVGRAVGRGPSARLGHVGGSLLTQRPRTVSGS